MDEIKSPRVLVAVLCGSFRKDMRGLRDARDAILAAGCQVLSPRDLEFVDEVDGFALAEHERNGIPGEIEEGHLDAISAADFVWLHAPDGYVGRSASMEVGFASAGGIPVFSACEPKDPVLASRVTVVADAGEALTAVTNARLSGVGRPLKALQNYYEAVARDRGYASETPQDVMLLLTEEIGELARAIRRTVGLIREGGYADAEDPAGELADVQLYLVHLANALNVDLAAAVARKEAANAGRHSESLRNPSTNELSKGNEGGSSAAASHTFAEESDREPVVA